MTAMNYMFKLHLFCRFCDSGGKIHVSLTAGLYVIICKTLKFQRLSQMTFFRTALIRCENTKNLHHFAKKRKIGGDFKGERENASFRQTLSLILPRHRWPTAALDLLAEEFGCKEYDKSMLFTTLGLSSFMKQAADRVKVVDFSGIMKILQRF